MLIIFATLISTVFADYSISVSGGRAGRTSTPAAPTFQLSGLAQVNQELNLQLGWIPQSPVSIEFYTDDHLAIPCSATVPAGRQSFRFAPQGFAFDYADTATVYVRATERSASQCHQAETQIQYDLERPPNAFNCMYLDKTLTKFGGQRYNPRASSNSITLLYTKKPFEILSGVFSMNLTATLSNSQILSTRLQFHADNFYYDSTGQPTSGNADLVFETGKLFQSALNCPNELMCNADQTASTVTISYSSAFTITIQQMNGFLNVGVTAKGAMYGSDLGGQCTSSNGRFAGMLPWSDLRSCRLSGTSCDSQTPTSS